MPVTQREYDIMQLEAQLRMKRLRDDWIQGFLGDRLKEEEKNAPKSLDIPAKQEIENDDSVLGGN